MNYTLEIYADNVGECRWRLREPRTRNIIGASSEGYEKRIDCVKNFRKLTGLSTEFGSWTMEDMVVQALSELDVDLP